MVGRRRRVAAELEGVDLGDKRLNARSQRLLEALAVKPLLAEFMKLLAQLGGYNNLPKEAPPGPQPLWIGIRRMLDFARVWLAFGPEAGTSRELSGG